MYTNAKSCFCLCQYTISCQEYICILQFIHTKQNNAKNANEMIRIQVLPGAKLAKSPGSSSISSTISLTIQDMVDMIAGSDQAQQYVQPGRWDYGRC